MLKKEFKRKDVERMRNLITGKAGSSSETQIGYSKKKEEYKEGDIWKEGRKTWTIKNGIKQTISKLDSIKKEIFTPLCCPECNKIMKHHLDESNYKVHKKCHDCVTKFEHTLRINGKYKEYRQNLIAKNSLTGLEEIESYLLDALNNTSNSSFVSEHGTIERWVGGKVKKERIKELEKVIKKTKQNIKNKIK